MAKKKASAAGALPDMPPRPAYTVDEFSAAARWARATTYTLTNCGRLRFRRTVTLALNHDGQAYAVALGYDPAGRVREVFISGSKTGSTLAGLLDDAAIVISLALQHGADPRALPNSMGQLGRQGERASVIG